jgi:hypothetical protein
MVVPTVNDLRDTLPRQLTGCSGLSTRRGSGVARLRSRSKREEKYELLKVPFRIRDDHYVRVLALLLLAHVTVLGANHRINAAEIVELVFTSLYSDHDDERLAKELQDAKLTQQLSPLVGGYFQDRGIGPQVLAALQNLENKSQVLSPPDQEPLLIQPIPTESGQTSDLKIHLPILKLLCSRSAQFPL